MRHGSVKGEYKQKINSKKVIANAMTFSVSKFGICLRHAL